VSEERLAAVFTIGGLDLEILVGKATSQTRRVTVVTSSGVRISIEYFNSLIHEDECVRLAWLGVYGAIGGLEYIENE